MIFNFIAFSIIFTIFGIIIFTSIESSLYSKPDEELYNFQTFKEDTGFEQPLQKGKEPFEPEDKGSRMEQHPESNDRPMLPSPRVIAVEWSEDGEISNQEQIGTLFYEHYLSELQFTGKSVGVISNIQINSYDFRSLMIENGDGSYTQLLINVDAEQSLLQNFEKLLIACSIIFIFLSIMASYLLSKKTMQPIITSWNKQVEFVENASHELRTPLTIIKNKLELLLTTPNAKVVDKFENIALTLSETNRLSKLTTDLLTLARADSSETQLDKTDFEFDSFVREVCEPYKEIANSQDKQVWFHLKSNQLFFADKQRIHQLLVILMDNALKYTQEGNSIGIKTFYVDNKIHLEISDTGIGITKDSAERIFERFYREDKARTRENGGTGLGLSIAKWIVSSHNGSIKASSNEPKGTIITIKFPK